MNRRSDLDWLRVIAFGLLILNHAGFAWTGWGWHLNSNETLPWLAEGMRFNNRWRNALIFMIAGGAIVLALGGRTAGAFAIDRVRRLLVPLVFGVFVLVPPQVYLEQLHTGQFAGSFLQWLPQAYARDNLAWHHLWFIAYIFVLSLALLPVFLWGRGPAGQAAQARLAGFLARTNLHWLMALPIAAEMLVLGRISHNTNYLIGDWYGIALAATLLLYGGFVFNTPQMLALLARQCWLAIAVGTAAFVALELLIFQSPNSHVRVLGLPVFAPLSAINVISWLFAAIGLGSRYLQRRTRFLEKATDAVYPFYILHQTVTVITVYWLLAFRVPAVPAYLLTVLSTFGVTWLIYAWVVRPWPWMRLLFGMKPLAKPAPLPVSAAGL